jgi:hypothetical protein
MNTFGLLYIYTWRCHSETPCIRDLKQTKNAFFQKWRIKSKIGPVWGLVPVRRGGYKEKVWEGEYGRNIMYSCMEMGK